MHRCNFRRRAAALFLPLLFFFFGNFGLLAETLQAVPGEVLAIDYTYAPPEGVPLMSIELYDADGRNLGRFKSYRVDGSAAGSSVAIARSPVISKQRVLVPLSSTIESGSYELRYYSASGTLLQTRTLQVEPRQFRSETIPLNYSLTELRSSDDPEKYEQALAIQHIYAGFNADRVLGSLEFRLPLPEKEAGSYRITSHYGDRRIFSYADERTARSIHTGIDFAAQAGTPVLAAEAGRVVLASDRIISGYSVVIEHLPGVYSIYFHLDRLHTKQGQRVDAGQEIGTVGMTGLATGPHLHWEVRVHGVAVDPAMLTQLK
jgi:murein DD-endopeptidase MepM/ murein hydrolase activator NlpD